MTPFGLYGRYYDLLYRDKPYGTEARYIHELLLLHSPAQIASILELGSGTGGHAQSLAESGLIVTGVDMSESMCAAAERRRGALPRIISDRLEFLLGDVRSCNVDRKFDAVVSLFHVMSYQTTNSDLLAALRTARRHLREGGIFLFDCWHGPGVLTDPPVVRVRRMDGDGVRVVRIAEPVMLTRENVVEVNYEINVIGDSEQRESFNETHRMRYLFEPEVAAACENCGFGLVGAYAWLKLTAPTVRDWTACFVAVAT